MRNANPLGSYLPGSGPLHRLRPGAKLLGLFVFAIVVVWVPGALSAAVALGIAALLAVLAGLRGRDFWRVARRFLLIAVPLFAFTMISDVLSLTRGSGGIESAPIDAWFQGAARGFAVVGDLFALILAASAVTASTALEDMLDTITWLLRPLRGVGIPTEQVSLAFSLTITAIPNILGIALESHAAAKARGLDRSPRALVVPLVIRTVAHAQLTGEALAARGLGEDEGQSS